MEYYIGKLIFNGKAGGLLMNDGKLLQDFLVFFGALMRSNQINLFFRKIK
jgi:hypothetical protein